MVSNGWLKQTIEKVSEIRGLPENMKIPLSTIRNRRNPICLTDRGCSSLMTPVEPYLVTLICAMAQIRRCLRASECIGLANDLIKGRPLEKEIIEWKKVDSITMNLHLYWVEDGGDCSEGDGITS